ncbi:enoyl-CoA hydratase/isomerase family protein [Pontitalea aquivivens]|uniref:enoyl-CoA hydratase/isomerase family protein n=1 Tax=Pontitalea aquivivens TaxID=3388663 RepID=UPI0039708AD8
MFITLARPAKRNALDGAMIAGLASAIERSEADPAVSIVCLRAEGPVFCAGIDLKAASEVQAQGAAAGRDDVIALTDAILRLARCSRPTIAVVDGPAFAAGVGLLAACDFVLATSRLSVSLTQVRNGLIPGFVAPLLAQAIGLRAARQIALSGEPQGAERLLQLGLVSEIVRPARLEDRLASLLDALRRGAPGALAATKVMLDRFAHGPLDSSHMVGINELVAAQRSSAEAAEGMTAFREKRLPAWYARTET